MKEVVVNSRGDKELVELDVIVRSVDGVMYLLSEEESLEFNTRKDAWEAGAIDRQKDILRLERNPLLLEADYKINTLEDNGQDSIEWRTYRQALRDITEQEDVYNIAWPEKPQVF